MDHKVSKDMISSGMIPSGEKTQADLGRTQYGSAPSPSKLMDAYKSMYEHHQKDKDGNTIPHEDEEINEGKIPAGLQAYLDKKKGKKEDKKDMKESFTYLKEQYDLVYEHFIGEGFSEEETFERMSNLTEEQLDEFMKALATRAAKYGASLGGNTPAPKMGPARPNAKPGQTGFKASSASEVVSDVNARKREASAFKAKPLRDKMDAALTKLRAGDLKFGSTSGSEQKPRVINKKFGSTGSRSNQTEDVDLFDVLSDKLIEEGYSKEESYKIMSNLTKEQLEEINEAVISGTLGALGLIGTKLLGGAKVAAAAAGKGLTAGKALAAKGLGAAKTAATAGAKKVASAAKTGMTKATDALGKVSNIAKDKAQGMGDTMTNMGKSVGDDIKDEIKRKILQGNDGGSNKISKTGTISTGSKIAASADLFDIVKGQLLDEGLSEEEIKDIMLTLTPDEIMEELSDIVKRNDAINKANAMKRAKEREVPQDIRDKSKKQYKAGTPRENPNDPYTKQDAKDIRDYYNK